MTGSFILFLSSFLFTTRVCAFESETVYFDVTDYGADGTDKRDDRKAINDVLALANERSETITVYIPDGNYYISGSLYIYSDTILKLGKNAVIYETPDFSDNNMIVGSHLREDGEMCECSAGIEGTVCKGYGYSRCSNVMIDGGNWVAYKDPVTGVCPGGMIIAFWHSKDITIKNTTCKNASGHSIDLSGVDTALVSNVSLDTTNAKTDDTAELQFVREFVHLDYCTEEGEELYGLPYDNTPSKNITVENCTFSNGFAGVGNHHYLPAGGKISTDIVVRGCTFNNLESYAIGEYSVDHLSVEGCKATNCMIFAHIRDSANISLKGNTFDAVGMHTFDDVYDNISGINIGESSNLSISDNSVRNTTNSGMNISKCNGGTISSNTVTGVGKKGIEYRMSKGMTVSRNNVSSADSALFLKGSDEIDCGADVTDNTFNSAEDYDIYLGKNANSCHFSGNTLVNYTFLKLADTFTGKLDLPVLSSITVDSPSYVYTGSEITPKVTVRDTLGRVLTEDIDYYVRYSCNVNAGDAQVRVHGVPSSIFYDQEITTPFKIAPKTITPRIELSATSFVYNKTKQRPSVKIYDGNRLLKNSQYKTEFSPGCTRAGTYKLKVDLKRNYAGSGTISFKIKKAKSKMKVSLTSKTVKVKFSPSKERKIRSKSFLKISNAYGTRSYKMVSGKKKYFSVSKTNGNIMVKPGTPRGTYKLKIKVTADGGNNYKSKSVKKTIQVKVF